MKKRYPILFAFCGVLAIGSMIAYSIVPALEAEASVAGNFTVTNSGNAQVVDSATNVRVMTVDLPAPGADLVRYTGGYALTAGDTLTAFGSNIRFADTDNDDDGTDYTNQDLVIDSEGAYIGDTSDVLIAGQANLTATWGNWKFSDYDHDDAQDFDFVSGNVNLIVNSADNILSADEIRASYGGMVDLTAFPAGYYYLETDADSVYEDGEDIIKMVHDGANATAAGDAIRLFGADDYYSDANADSGYANGELIVSSADANLDSSDTIATAGAVKNKSTTPCGVGATSCTYYDPGAAGVPYCFVDDKDTSSTITVGDVLVSDTCFTGYGDNYTFVCGAEPECASAIAASSFKFIDDNANAEHDTGEAVWNDDGDDSLEAGELIFGASSTALTSLNASTDYFFNDNDAGGDSDYDDGEDIFKAYFAGAANNVASGDVIRAFAASIRFADNNNDGDFTASAVVGGTPELITNAVGDTSILEAGEIITAGYVDLTAFGGNYKYSDANHDSNYTYPVGGTAEVIVDDANTDDKIAASELRRYGDVDVTSFATPLRFYDGAVNGVFNSTEPIVNDADNSGYYNGDKLSSLKIGNPGTCLDSALDRIAVWEDTNNNDAFNPGAGDTKIGEIVVGPFIGGDISIGGSVYTATSANRTIFVSIDGDSAFNSSCTFQAKIPFTGGAPYAALMVSTNDGPTDSDVDTSDVITIDSQAPLPTDANITVTKTENAGNAGIANPTDVITAVWDAAADTWTDVASVNAVFTDFGGGTVAMRDDGAGCDSAGGDNSWCATYTVAAGAIDDVGNVVTINAATDTAGNIAIDVVDGTGFSVDNEAPTVDTAAIDITGGTGLGGFKNGDLPTFYWYNDGSITDNNLDIVTVSFNAAEFKAGDTALVGVDNLDVYSATITGALDSQDDINNNVTVTATDDAGNVTVRVGINGMSIDTILPAFSGANAVVALKQDGTATNSPAKSWYYYDGKSLKIKVTNVAESDGNPLSDVRACLKSMKTDNQADTCDSGEFTVGDNVTSLTVDNSTTSTSNYTLNAVNLGSLPSQKGGYPINIQLIDDMGNITESAGDSQIFIAIWNIDPKVEDATINNATTTDWTTITDFTNVAGLTFNANVLGQDVARITFNTNVNLTADATITALQSFAANVHTASDRIFIDSADLAALDVSATLMMRMATANQPGLDAKDNSGTHLAYIPNNAGPLDSFNLGAYGTVSNFVWNGVAQTLTYDVTGFSEYDSDNTPPTILAVEEYDVDNNGYLDETRLTFSEAIKDSSVTVGDFTIGGTVADSFMATTSTNGEDPNVANDNIITIKKIGGIWQTASKEVVYTAGSLTDLVGNALSTVTVAAGSVTDSARPVGYAARFYDQGANGSVDYAQVFYSENVTWNGLDLSQFTVTANDLTGFFGNPTSFTGNGGTTAALFLANVTSNLTGVGAGVLPTIAYVQSGTSANRVKDLVGNDLVAFGPINLLDNAAPVLASHTPTTGATEVSPTASVVYNFTEPMVTTFNHGTQFTSTPNPGGWGAVWSNGNKTVTLSHTDFNLATTYSIANTIAQINASSGILTTLASAGDWTFDSQSGGRIGGGGGSSATPSVSFLINNGAAETTSSSVTLNLSVSNATEMLVGNDVNFVGATWESASTSKVWTLPAGLGAKSVYVAVRSGSGGIISSVVSQSINVVEKAAEPTIDVDNSTLAVDKTSAKSDGAEKITAKVTVKMSTGAAAVGKSVVLTSSREVEDKVNAVSSTTDSSGVATFEITSSFEGVSTLMASVDGYSITKTASIQFIKPTVVPTEEPKIELVGLNVGDLIKSNASAVVYYYGADGKRHSFANQTIFYSYYTDFSSVKTIPVDQMAGIGLGGNAKVRPGTWLIKIQTDPKVYAVEPGGIIRWVETEAIAKALYGTTWNKKIIDVSSAFFGDYKKGPSLSTTSHPNAALIQYEGNPNIYYIMNGVKRKISDMSAFNANRFQTRFKQVVSSSLVYGDGSAITGKEDSISEVVY